MSPISITPIYIEFFFFFFNDTATTEIYTLSLHDALPILRRDFPVALASLLQVPGLGPGRARAVYKELGISTLSELEDAARAGRLYDVQGFGPKAVETLLANLERLKTRSTR